MVFDLVVLPLWLPLWFILSSFYMSPHCDSSSHSLCNVCHFSLYYFVFSLMLHVWYFVVLNPAFLASIVVLPSSHNNVAFLCCCSVDYFILIVAILKYDYKFALNIMVKKLSMVGTCNHQPTFEFVHSNLHPLSLLLLHIFQLHVYLFTILSLPMTFTKCLCKFQKNTIREF